MSNIKETLFDLFQLDRMPPEKGLEMLNSLSQLVFQSVLARVLPMLTEEEMQEYESIVEKKEADALFAFLNEKVPDFEKIVQEEAELLHLQLSEKLKNN